MDNFNKLFLHSSFHQTIAELNQLNIQLPLNPSDQEMDFGLYTYPPDGKLVSNIEEIKSYKLDPDKGSKLANSEISICAYDESMKKFSGLEGTAFLTSHSIICHQKSDYRSLNLLTFYFYTRSKAFTQKSQLIKFSNDPETDSKIDYVKDRTDFIINNTPDNSIILIDGPLIGGQVSSHTIRLNDELLKKRCIPLFFVKNSTSNLVTDYIEELKGKYNSDLHWAFKILKQGERSNLFNYIDKYNERHAKLFCYLKAFNLSPQRVEIHSNTFEKYSNIIFDLFDLIYYLLLVQGSLKNPQVRSIAIAEKYARETLKLIDINKLMKSSGITPTMNQERFGW